MTLQDIADNLRLELGSKIERSGIMYRLFGRAKTIASIEHKIGLKGDDYRSGKSKINDIIGLRIVVYFPDDVDVLAMYFDDNSVVKRHIDTPDTDTFRPQCLNITKPLPEKYVEDFRSALPQGVASMIDNTYEIQIRTVFSEGWHEVEHDMRYKCKEDWAGYEGQSRVLNGIIAQLETSEWTMRSLFREMALENYTRGNFRAMLRNKMRIRLKSEDFSPRVNAYLNDHRETARRFLMSDRMVIILSLIIHKKEFPLTHDALLFLVNRIDLDDQSLRELEPDDLSTLIDEFIES